MATTTTSSTTSSTFKGGLLQPVDPKIVLSPEQESHRLREAQELLRDLKVLITEADNPGVEILSSLFARTEELTLQAARNPEMAPETRKTLEDITALLISARQLGRNKEIGDRLQKISEETALALKAVKGPQVAAATKEATETLMEYMTNWRPLFYLMTSSREFRKLLLDSASIARRVVYSFTEDFREESKQRFVEGEPTTEIALDVKEKAQEKVKQNEVPQMTDEEWDRLQDDVQRVLCLLAKEPTYREGISRIFNLLDQFQKTLTEEPLQAALSPENVHIRRVAQETEELVAAFSGRDTLEQWKFHLRAMMLEVQKNENLKIYLQELKEFILKAKSEEEIRSQEFKSQSKELAHRGRELMREFRDKPDFRLFLNSSEDMMNNIKNDEMLTVLRQHAGIVQADLSYLDNDGKAVVDVLAVGKLQGALLPVLVDALKYIPIPKIYSNDSDREFWLDNLVLCSYDIIPENIKFQLQTDTQVSMRDIEVKGTHTHMVIELDKLLTEIKDIEFFYRKKSFPGFEDHGKVTFRITGKGAKLVFTYNLLQRPEDKVPRISEGKASFDISEMSIDFDKSTLRHPTMVPMLTQLWKMQIRHQIEYEVENNLTGFIQKLGDIMTNSLEQINRPLLTGLELAKNVVKSSQVAQVYEKRREKLE
jgi:hypothetical protein